MDPKLVTAIRGADLLLIIGEGLTDVATGGYELIVPPTPAQYLVHAHPSAAEIGRVVHEALGGHGPNTHIVGL